MISKFSRIIVILGTLVMVAVMSITGKPLHTASTPHGILHLEFANTPTQVRQVLRAWNNGEEITTSGSRGIGGLRALNPEISQGKETAIAAAKTNTWFDFLFIIFYTSLFIMFCKTLSGRFSSRSFFSKAGRWMASAAIIAALLDVVENIGMLQSLFGNVTAGVALVTAGASFGKWFIVCLTILYIVTAFLFSLRKGSKAFTAENVRK